MGLQPILQRGGACQIVGTTYPSSSFAPTKLNVSDDLAQDVEIRRPCKFSLWDSVRLEVLRKLHSSGLSHPLANYIRLSLLITFLREDSATSFKISLLPHPTQLMMSRPMDLYLGSFLRRLDLEFLPLFCLGPGFGFTPQTCQSFFLLDFLFLRDCIGHVDPHLSRSCSAIFGFVFALPWPFFFRCFLESEPLWPLNLRLKTLVRGSALVFIWLQAEFSELKRCKIVGG